MIQVVAQYPGVDFSDVFGTVESRGKVKLGYIALCFIRMEVITEISLWMKHTSC